MSYAADAATRQYRQTLTSPQSRLDDRKVAALAGAWNDSLALCRELGDAEGVRECRDRGARSVRFAAQQDSLVEAICARLDADLRSTCRSTVFG